ncbi:putative tricarboxylic transport membrane protein [Aureimonas altamirensis DSM 21988]|uniref:Tricarboxylic transport membrane protein n=2 Tax=Aureimonas altamirensis TaxID=370622 RepID=A0ABY1IJK4_9HYPH|nr:tripartite tricarboxylate transporter substrate binding protein [Aureimonas altamirensis]SHJ26583.1 putative tricarboxylic transport membrane protein [Aureimonas altamirensis DSM 21988]
MSMIVRMGRLAGLGAFAWLGIAAATPAVAQEYPARDIQMIIPFGVGGGSDTLARTIANVMLELDLLPVSVLPENRPGGSGAVGYGTVAQQKGNPYVIATVSVSFFTTPLLGASPVTYKDFTPLAAIAYSPYVLAVRADSPYRSLEDMAAAERLTTSTVGVVSDAALLAKMMSNELDVQIDAVPFDGEGEALAAVLGGHVDFVFMNPSEVMAQVDAGAMRPVAVSSAARIAALPEVPSFKELGHDIEHVQLRGLVMPGDVEPAVVTYWNDVLRKVAESDEWRTQYVERFHDEAAFLPADKFGALIEETNARYESIMRDLGLL